MRLLPALLPLLAGLAGCIVIEAPTPAAEPEGTGTSAPPALPPSVGEVGVSFTWNPEYPAVGEEVSFEAAAEGLDGRSVKAWHWDWGDGGSASGQDATHAYAATGDRTVRLGVEVSDGSTAHSVCYLFVVASRGSGSGSEPSGPGPEEPNSPETPPAPPHIPGNFTCPVGPV